MLSQRKILIIRFSSIGDIILTTPVARVIKTNIDQVEVHYLTKTQYAGMLMDNPYIDRVIEFEKDLPGLIRELKKERCPHHIIDT